MPATLRPILVLVLVLSLPAFAGRAAEKPPAKGKKPAVESKKSGPKITISKETTYVLGPIREDGSIDYLAALNEIASKGVTPQNNAAVLFWQAIGPGPIPKEHRKQFFKLLRIEPLPDDGPYFVPLKEFAASIRGRSKVGEEEDLESRQLRLAKELEEALRRPWSGIEFPDLARWLAVNEAAMAKVARGVKLARCYSPYFSVFEPLPVCFPDAQLLPMKDVSLAIVCRAMRRTRRQDHGAAWADLMTCRRLARLVAQGPTVRDRLFGPALDRDAVRATVVFAHAATVDADSAQLYAKDLQALPSFPDVAEGIGIGTRLSMLDTTYRTARDGPSVLWDILSLEVSPDRVEEAKEMVLGESASVAAGWSDDVAMDWNQVLRMANAQCDRFVETWKQTDRTRRTRKLVELTREYDAPPPEESRHQHLSADVFTTGRLPDFQVKDMVREIAGVGDWLPNGPFTADASDSAETRNQLAQLAIALAAYRADHGAYPTALSKVSPEYIEKLPNDIFTGKDLHYARRGKGYVLYSVGPNQRDDGGKERTVDDADEYLLYSDALNKDDDGKEGTPDNDADDIAVRTAEK